MKEYPASCVLLTMLLQKAIVLLHQLLYVLYPKIPTPKKIGERVDMSSLVDNGEIGMCTMLYINSCMVLYDSHGTCTVGM